MNKTIRKEVIELFKKSQEPPSSLIKESDLANLPDPVKSYLIYAQIIGKRPISAVRLKQAGHFRTKQKQKWMSLYGEEYYTTQPPAFLWYGQVWPFPLVTISARDRYSEGEGNMLVKLWSLFKIADASGPEAAQGELLRYLASSTMFPTFWLSENIKWQAVNDRSAKATIEHHGITASAVVHFNDKYQVTHLEAERYREINGQYSLDRWVAAMSEYEEREGLRIPMHGIATWRLSTGNFNYVRFSVTEIEFNKPAPY